MDILFWGSASADLKATIFLLIISFFVALILYVTKRNIFFSALIFSVLTNLSFLLNSGSDMFDYYNIVWLLYFSFFIWPILNILLIIWYARAGVKRK